MDSLSFKAGIHGFLLPISFGGRTHTTQVSALGRSGGRVSTSADGFSMENSAVNSTPQKTSISRFSFAHPLSSLWPGGGKGNDGISLEDAIVVVDDEGEVGVQGRENESGQSAEGSGSWVMKILHVRSHWTEQGKSCEDVLEQGEKSNDRDVANEQRSACSYCDGDEAEGCGVGEDQEKFEFDRDSFSRLLERVSLAETKLYAQMSYLGNLAYAIPNIKPGNLLKHQGLHFITSSLEKKAQSMDAEKEQASDEDQEKERKPGETEEVKEQRNKSRYQISASAAYDIAASAASYLQSHTRSLFSYNSSKSGTTGDPLEEGSETHNNAEIQSSEMASFVATSNSVTAVVAAKEETKQAVAEDLNSALSSPCEWFICDDDHSGTRFFIIQGSESLASWQTNLLFEPIHFEGLDVLVHRGIYEAAKGIYEQMLPEVRAHLKSHGDSATFRFTGHSLGGSLSLLVNLMLLIRGEVPRSSLLPVITFGAPSIMCGGDQLLRRLGLPRNHVQAITMHRDIVPRAFSCNYPNHVAELLKAVNGNFRNHPCLKNQKLLYAPMGEILILQPDEKFSPHHHLLPSGSGLYLLGSRVSDSNDSEKQLRAAQTVFFNSPHPLEILSDHSAYGSDGTIYRDHDMNSYLRSMLGVIRQELNHNRKAKREHRRQVWWPLVAPQGIHAGVNVVQQVTSNNMIRSQLSFSGIFRTGRVSLKRFSRLVTSQHMHLLIVLLFPVELFCWGHMI